MPLPTLNFNPEIVKKIGFFFLLIGGLALILILPSSRDWLRGKGRTVKRVFLVENQAEVIPGPAVRASNSQDLTLSRLSEMVGELEKKSLAQEKELARQQTEMLNLQEQYKAAVKEVGTTNDLLAKQQAEWLLALRKAEAGNFSYLSEVPEIPTSPTAGSSQTKSGKININSASAQQLDELPGIGPTYAERIVAYREAHGSFHSPDDLLDVTGIGESILSKIRDLIEV